MPKSDFESIEITATELSTGEDKVKLKEERFLKFSSEKRQCIVQHVVTNFTVKEVKDFFESFIMSESTEFVRVLLTADDFILYELAYRNPKGLKILNYLLRISDLATIVSLLKFDNLNFIKILIQEDNLPFLQELFVHLRDNLKAYESVKELLVADDYVIARAISEVVLEAPATVVTLPSDFTQMINKFKAAISFYKDFNLLDGFGSVMIKKLETYDLSFDEIDRDFAYSKGLELERTDPVLSAVFYYMAAQKKHVDAVISLAIKYIEGEVVIQDKDRALTLLLKISENPLVSHVLGSIYFFGKDDDWPVDKDFNKAVKYFTRRQRSKVLSCDLELAFMFEKGGFGLKADRDRAEEHYINAVREEEEPRRLGTKGAGYAHFAYALFLQSKPGNIAKWKPLLEKADELGNEQATLMLGNLYCGGYPDLYTCGGATDKISAFNCYKKLKDTSPEAAVRLGLMFKEAKHYDKARVCFEIAAKLSKNCHYNKAANINLGLMYQFGAGVAADYKQAIEHFKLAITDSEDVRIDHESDDGRYFLAILFMQLLDAGVDLGETSVVVIKELFKKGIRTESVESFIGLGCFCVRQGEYTEAEAYFSRAESKGSLEAKLKLAALAKFLEAQKLGDSEKGVKNLPQLEQPIQNSTFISRVTGINELNDNKVQQLLEARSESRSLADSMTPQRVDKADALATPPATPPGKPVLHSQSTTPFSVSTSVGPSSPIASSSPIEGTSVRERRRHTGRGVSIELFPKVG
ncbi:MAG: sel1 repeat family protein [Gammaproteobacteria bacterium]|nr:sel1 repeat family protein [Gammaproteobacteria bacterium]